jgi:hypothetical protein
LDVPDSFWDDAELDDEDFKKFLEVMCDSRDEMDALRAEFEE